MFKKNCLKKISICSIMCIIRKIFFYEENKHPVIKYKDQTWVKAKTVANNLRNKNIKKSILDHVDPEDK